MAVERVPVPDVVRAHAEAALAGTAPPVVHPRDASTVVLLREPDDGAGAGVQVYLLRRHSRMAFAAGQAVFPGGAVDERDRSADVGWAGPAPERWAERFGCAPATARGLVCAAVRETFEESGVLLAGPDEATVVADTAGDDWEVDRVALEAGGLSLADVLGRRGLVVRSDLLGAWAHWITPAFEPRRYDTRFFVAALPAGQRTRDVSGESDAVAWMRPADALAAVRDGRLMMMPPTVLACEEVVDIQHPADVLARAERRRFVTVEPRLVTDGDDLWLETDLGGVA